MLILKFDLLYLLLVFGSLAFTRADYYIDDANSSVLYTPSTMASGQGSWWPLNLTNENFAQSSNGTSVLLDYTRLYAQTLLIIVTRTFGVCSTAQHCQINIPFTGSGITIYGVLMLSTTNITISLDGEMVRSPTPTPWQQEDPPIYNFTLYDIQSLPISFHVLTITAVSGDGNGTTNVSFDYAYVNETNGLLSPTMSTSSSTNPMSSASAASVVPHHSRSVVASAVGGTLAGLAAVAILFFALMYFRKKRRVPLVIGTESSHIPFSAHHAGLQPPHMRQPDMAITPTSSSFNTTPLDFQLPSSNISAHNSRNPQPASSSSGTFLIPPTTVTYSGDRRSNTTSAGNQLIDEQAGFVHALYNHNIPAPAVARMMERKIGEDEVGTFPGGKPTVSGFSRRDTVTTVTTEPPSYTPWPPLPQV